MGVMQKKIHFGNNDLILETGRLAKQADAAVTVSYGGTVVLVTCCMAKEIREGTDFLPLSVEYQEKTYAAGRIPGGFFKREGRPSENETLVSRLIDRPLRPLFPKGFFNEVQIMALVLSSDGENDPDILAVIGASSALGISSIPFNTSVGCCRVACLNNEFILNPTYKQLEQSSLDLVVAGTKDGVITIESKASEVSEDLMKKAIDFAFKNLLTSIEIQQELIQEAGKEKEKIALKETDPKLIELIKENASEKLNKICLMSQKEEREEALALLHKEMVAKFIPHLVEPQGQEFAELDIKNALVEIEGQIVRRQIIEQGIRVDKRRPLDIRPISCDVGVLPCTHGSGLFTRGQTQALCVTTLGTSSDQQMIEALEGESFKSFMLHYSFPPFSVGEIRPIRGPGRREIGHGALAEKALKAVMPTKEEFPYTIRVVSEILESNGSSSMATICAATLSLMDAGVPIKQPVAGIALGLIKEDSKSIILTDITGLEDHFGDMDFKVAGTKNGICVFQLDIKISNLGLDLLNEAIDRAHQARFVVLEAIEKVIAMPRKEISKYAPRITVLKIDQSKIGSLIGPGGKTIRKIIDSTGTTIDIEDDGTVLVASPEKENQEKAIAMIRGLTEEIEVGKIYTGKITRIAPFGAFCEIAPNKDGLIHVSELSDSFVKNVEDVVKLGDEVRVKVVSIDELGRINLSKKKADEPKT